MLDWAFSRMPSLNKDIINGIAKKQMEKVEFIVDWIFRCSATGYPPGMKYLGARRCTPKETFAELTKSTSIRGSSSNNVVRTFDLSRSDVFLEEYRFSFNGVELNPRYINLPFISPGGIMFNRGTQYVITPVITGKDFNVEENNIYLPSTRLRMGFWQINTGCMHNDQEINQTSVGSYLYKLDTKKRSNLKPLLIHYILSKYGLSKALEFYGVKFKIGFAELDSLDKSEWHVFKSRQIPIRRRDMNGIPPVELRIAISSDTFYMLMGNIISGIFYILDNMPIIVDDLYELENPSFWTRLLYFFIHKEQCSEAKLVEKMTTHIESMETTIDSITINALKSSNISCDNIYEIFKYLTIYFQDIIIHYDFGTMYGLQINTVEPLTFGIRRCIFNAMYDLQKIPVHQLNPNKINKVLQRRLARDVILDVKGHGEMVPTFIASTCPIYGPSADIISYADAAAMGSKDTPTEINDRGLFLNASVLEATNVQACVGREFTGRGSLNVFFKLSEAYTTVRGQEHQKEIQMLEAQLKRYR